MGMGRSGGLRGSRVGATYPRRLVPYDRDILDEPTRRSGPTYPEVDVAVGLVVEDRASGFCGDVVRWIERGGDAP